MNKYQQAGAVRPSVLSETKLNLVPLRAEGSESVPALVCSSDATDKII